MQVSDRIGIRMKLHDLHVLMTVVQAGSMNKAAALLHTTQPAVSRSIAELEQAFGVRLLDRYQRGVEPTEYGRALLGCGVAVFDELRQGVKSVQSLADPAAGEVRVGCSPVLSGSFVSAVIDRLSQRYPRVVFSLVTADWEALHRQLRERDVDLLVTRKWGPTADDELDFEFLINDSYVVAAGVQHRMSRRRSIKLAELINESWVMPPPGTVAGAIAIEAFEAVRLKPPRATAYASPEVRMSLVATGRFLSIVSEHRLSAMRLEIKALPVEPPLASVPSGIVTLKKRTLTPAAKAFIDHAREVAKSFAHRRPRPIA
jgi:DNA-binding transcriptional LysR family regulator